MSKYALSRRTFLAAAGLGSVGLGTAALLGGCDTFTHETGVIIAPTPTPNPSPLVSGPYQTAGLLIGENSALALPQPLSVDAGSDPADLNFYCQDGEEVQPSEVLPTTVAAQVYYPFNPNQHHSSSISTGPFPVLLYAHAIRFSNDPCVDRIDWDFTSISAMLQHVASYGCVVVVPDLSFVPEGGTTHHVLSQRALVLASYYAWLTLALNGKLFANQLDLSRLVLVGHSTGGGAVPLVGSMLAAAGTHLQSLAYGLIAPYFGSDGPASVINASVENVVVLQGGQDTIIPGVDPAGAYAAGGEPKTLVMIPGASHYGYTDLCTPDNNCSAIFGQNGTISRSAQQQTGAAYLAALVRYYALGDVTARPYLSGAQMVDGLESLGVSGIQVQAEGFSPVILQQPTIGANR